MPLGDVLLGGSITANSTSSTAPAAGSTVVMDANGIGPASIQVEGTFVGTLQVEGRLAGTTTGWSAVSLTTLAGVPATTITLPGIWTFNAAPFSQIRVRSTAWTSGTAVVTLGGSPYSGSGGGGGGGGGGASTIADGADVAEGATTDVAVQGDNPGTISAKLRGLNKSIAAGIPISTLPALPTGANVIGAVTQSGTWNVTVNAALPTGANVIGAVTQSGGPWSVAGAKTSNNAAPGATNVGALVGIATAAAPSLTEGNQVGLSTDLAGNQRTIVTAALPTGANVIGAVTQSGTWNVSVNTALPAGANAIGTVGVTANVTPADRTATGSVAATNANVALTANGCGTVTAAIATNASWNGTLTFQATTDGSNWIAISALNVNTGAFGQTYATANTNALFQINTAAYAQVRVIALTYSAGSATVTLEGSAGASCFPGLLDSAGRLIAVGAAASGAAVAGNPVAMGTYDGANVNYARSIPSGQGASTNTGAVYAAVGLSVGSTTMAPWGCQNAFGDAITPSNYGAVVGNLFNGATFDRPRSNVEVVIQASTATIVQTLNTDITTFNATSLAVHINVTNYNGGTLTVALQWKDANGLFWPIPGATTGAKTSGADLVLVIGRGTWPTTTTTEFYVPFPLPRTVRIVQTIATQTITYSAAYSLCCA